MPVALSTWCRGPQESPDAWRGRALTAGASGLALDRTLDEAWLAALRQELSAHPHELPVLAVEAACPRLKSGVAPRLAAEDKEERRAALNLAVETVELAAAVGARAVTVRLGGIDTKHDWAKLGLKFARRERLGTDRLMAERTQLAPMALDLARWGLDTLVERAAAAGLTIGLVNRVRPFDIPDDFELRALLDDFRGAPLAPWLDAAALHARASIGLTDTPQWLAMYGPTLAGAYLTDAVGLRGGLPWGLGEVDRAAVLAALPATAIRVAHFSPGATDEEIAAAVRG